MIKKQHDKESYFNQSVGFINSTIHAMLQDENERLWVATNGGLIGFDVLNNKFQNYGKGSGLTVLEFSDGASFSQNDTLFFGGFNGFVVITNNKKYVSDEELTNLPFRFTNINVFGAQK